MEKLIIGEDNICPVTNEVCDDECRSPGSECNLSGYIESDPLEGLEMRCEYRGCKSTEGRDYYRKYQWIKKLLEIDKEWRDEPIYLCKEHKGNHKLV